MVCEYRKARWMVQPQDEEKARNAIRWLRGYCDGNVRRASEILKVPYSTVHSWFQSVSLPNRQRLKLIEALRDSQ